MNIWLGFPLCFYNGMTELWKIGFSLLFPLYLLTIVVAHMILSHCCVRNSNRIPHSSVQIFVTVIYISFSKLVQAVINVFVLLDIYTANTIYKCLALWWSVKYGVDWYLILMIITLLYLLSLLYYLLFFAHLCWNKSTYKVNEYVRPLQEGKEYWFVVSFFLLVSTCIAYTYYKAVNYFIMYVITTQIMTLFLLLQVYTLN